jgi:hypothetical protein
VLNIEDDETIIDFYTKFLMLPAERLEGYRAGNVPFPSVRINHRTVIDLFPKKLWEQDGSADKGFSNLNHFCHSLTKEDWEHFTVDFVTIKFLSEKVRCNGGELEDPEPQSIFPILKGMSLRRGSMRKMTGRRSACLVPD